MANQENPFQPAIDALEADLAEAERHMNALLSAINVLRAKAGVPPRVPSGGGGAPTVHQAAEAHGPVVQIQHDSFYGKRMGTAARELLEMRKVQGIGPAKAREIFDALQQGGFQFNTKDNSIAVTSLRNMLTKNTAMFVKLPNGTFGLKAWYPNLRTDKVQKPFRAAQNGNATGEGVDEETVASSDDEATA